MEIRRWLYYVLFNCILIKYLDAKTISLNEVITAESNQKEAFETTLPPEAESTGKRHSLIKRLKSTSRIKDFLKSGLHLDHSAIGGHKLSPLKYKKTFLIKSPLKPRKLNILQKSRYKRKNQSAKREISGNESLKQKYIPLLKSLSMLFDNLLNSDESESYELKTKKFKRNRFYSEETFKVPLSHPSESDYGSLESKPQEKTITVSSPFTTETSFAPEIGTTTQATPTTSNFTTTRNFGTFRQHKNIPILLTRNTSSNRRVDNGIGKRSGASLHGDIERNITRYYGDNEHAAGCRENTSCSEHDEKNTFSNTRSSARSFRFPRPTGHRDNTGLLPRRIRIDTEDKAKNASVDESIRENQFKNRRNQTKSPRILQESVRRLRGFTSEDSHQITEPIKPKEVREEGDRDVTHIDAGYQRITDRGSSITEEDQKVRQRDETKTLVDTSVGGARPVKTGVQGVTVEDTIAAKKDQKVLQRYETMTQVDNSAGASDVRHANDSFQRVADEDSATVKKDEKVNQRDETIKLADILENGGDVLKDGASYQQKTDESSNDSTGVQKFRQRNEIMTLGNSSEGDSDYINVDTGYQQITDVDKAITKGDQNIRQEDETMNTVDKSKSVLDVTHADNSYQRIADESSPSTREDQKVHQRDETMMLIDKSERYNSALPKNISYQQFTGRGISSSLVSKEDQKVYQGNETKNLVDNSTTVQKKSPVVMIFDGYSIARHKNGENKFSEKSIRVRS